MSHIIFATRRSANAVGAMSRWAFKAADLEREINRPCRSAADKAHRDDLKAELKRVQAQAKRATARFEKAQRDLSWS